MGLGTVAVLRPLTPRTFGSGLVVSSEWKGNADNGGVDCDYSGKGRERGAEGVLSSYSFSLGISNYLKCY